jgi:hypothetical protein
MRWLIGALVFGLSGCLQLGKASDSDAGGSSAGTAGAGGDGSRAATGTNCGVDPSSGIALCLGISSCPTVRVDPDQFPDCGYRISGGAIDLECLCGEALCPMGSAASCLDAQALLRDQSAQGVCAAVADGKCTTVKQVSVSSSSMCDKSCRAECGGDPNCVTLCGC